MDEARKATNAADVVIEFKSKVLLVKRKNEPFKGKLAFPGGMHEYEEKIEDTAIREAKEETNLDIILTDILGVYSDPAREPTRGQIITTVFVATPTGGQLKAGDDADEVGWYSPIDIEPSKMAFDHWKVFNHFLQYKKKQRTFWSSR